jgi:hypothetical protein
MAIQEVKRTHTAKEPDGTYVDDPKVVKIAKLGIILGDKNTDPEIRRLCVYALRRIECINDEELSQLLFYMTELEKFKEEMEEDDEE